MSRRKVKRVALLLASLQGRGVQRVRMTLAQAFLDRGHQVDLVIANPNGPMAAAIPPGVNVHTLNTPRLIGAVPKLVRYFRERAPDAVLSAEDHFNAVAIMARAVSRKRFRLATSVHIMPSFDAAKPITTRSHWMRYVIRALYPYSDQVIAVSHDLARNIEEVCGFPQRDILVIHNPVDVAKVRTLAEEPVDHAWFDGSDIPVVIGVGALSRMKNFALLVKAVAEVRQTRPVRLLLIGEGPERERLERLIASLGAGDDIRLAGFTRNPAAYMARASLLALTSTHEPFGNVLTEALACGTPIVSVDCPGGPSEILDDGRFGTLVDSYEPPALASAISTALDRPRGSERLVARAMNFDISVIVERYCWVLGI